MTNTIDLADGLADALAEGGIYTYDVYSNYSGRGMFGEQCSGLVGDFDGSSVKRAVEQYVQKLQAEIDDPQPEGWDDDEVKRMEEQIEELKSLLRSISQDSMGRDAIVYFPGWVIEE